MNFAYIVFQLRRLESKSLEGGKSQAVTLRPREIELSHVGVCVHRHKVAYRQGNF